VNKSKWEYAVDTIFIIVLICLLVGLVITGNAKDAAQSTCETTTQATTAETTEYITEPAKEETVVTEPPMTLYDVPLEEDLQIHIIETAEANGIDPAIIFAMAYHESTYRADAVNKYGCYGLLQIKKSCHGGRMKRLGCTDLLDPYQNVTVAVDYLAEQIDRYDGNVAKGITAYNKGHYAGKITYYAKAVMKKAEELRGDFE
jgi:soluble lytic murein transglycosylase-like protein